MEADESVRLPEEEAIAQMSTLVFAATDTTTNALASTLWLLAQHPNVQQKLRDEVVGARAGRVGDLTYDELDTLPYMDAIARETLRLHTPICSIPRTPLEDIVLPLAIAVTGSNGAPVREIIVPRGTGLILSLRGLNRSTEYWGPDASAWRPERWLKPLPQKIMEAKIPGIYSHLMTFGGGGFSCIGFKFSQLEMKVILALLIERFAFSLPENKEIKWNMAGIQFPTVAGSAAQPSLPLKMRLLEPLAI